ncbi:MAG: pitrilysin family protein [Myxococcales bacterium]|nr:pitrilysin family protein [Myxococcales bacterium]
MRLLLLPRRDEPTISGGWVAHVGSANERPGITGISHLFEHMMFKGTPVLGTKDPKKDQQLIAEQERIRDLIRAEERKLREALRRGEIDDITRPEVRQQGRLGELERQFDKLVQAQREILVKNEFDAVYTRHGGTGMNAFTTHDLTAYFITVPKNKLELWFWMESERLLRPVFREFYAERDVVHEERRMRTESTPLGKFDEAFEALFWDAHPYGWPVVGWASDLAAITKAQADEYYATYYAPGNLTAILVGDFDEKQALSLAERYFGRLRPSKSPPPDVVTLEPRQVAEKRMIAEAEVNPQVDILWHTVPFGHKDSYPLQVVAELLNDRTGRLHKALILPRGGQPGQAVKAVAQQESRKYAGLFNITAECREGVRPEDLEKSIYAVLDRLATEPVPAEELQKVKNGFAANAFRRLSSNMPILFQLLVNEGLGNWREINEGPRKIQAVTAADVQRVVTKYLLPRTNRAVAIYYRKQGA